MFIRLLHTLISCLAQAVEAKLSELMKEGAGAHEGPPDAQAPLGKEAEVALRLL